MFQFVWLLLPRIRNSQSNFKKCFVICAKKQELIGFRAQWHQQVIRGKTIFFRAQCDAFKFNVNGEETLYQPISQLCWNQEKADTMII